jgi:non-lysosomal glucosylceramidase
MSEDNKVSRREFILENSAAVVGAAAAGIVPGQVVAGQNRQQERQTPGRTAPLTSPAGSVIPYSREELTRHEPARAFTGRQLSEIAFPLGGIGTGTVSLGGRGDLRDWEIFNRPNKGKSLPFTFVALWARREGEEAAVRVVEAPLQPPFRGAQGYPREGAQGLPRLGGATFRGAYPFAEISFEDESLPVGVVLEAFNPMIPLEVDDSSLPVAIFRYRLANRTAGPVDVALAFSILNPIGYDGRSVLRSNDFAGFGQNVTRVRRDGPISGLEMTSQKYEEDDLRFGTMALVTTGDDVSARAAWEEGDWWDSFQKWFDEYAAGGGFKDGHEAGPSADGTSYYATLAPRVRLLPGASRAIEFLLAWHFPLRENYWNSEPRVHGRRLRNDYGTRFQSAWEVARHVALNLERLEAGTRAFRRALEDGTLPGPVVDAISSQMSIIRTNTCLLLAGKRFFAFEGTNDDAGCCPMNCTHVWNYEQALAHLYPSLERSMRVTDFTDNMRADGSMAFRTLLPTGRAQWKFKPAADGQMGCVLKLYREWQMSGDDAFLRSLWPAAKRALEYAWVNWDADRDGVMEGEQHNTYDIEFYGPNTMMGTLYLGALAAGERMARAMGDAESAAEYRRVFESGRVKLDAQLWRDGYFVQRVPDPSEVKVQQGEQKEAWYASAVDRGALKYQYGEGCLSDQLLGQWFAAVVNLGHVLPADHVREALRSIYTHNFRHEFFSHPNTQRLYALNDEKGLVLCSWPRGQRPALPFVYSDEVWTGIEYQVAAHLIYEGLVLEGLAVTRAVRDRYDGERRNPWNEVECGSHYARALASWSLLTALSGYSWSAPDKRLAFAPRIAPEDFRTMFTTGQGWGVFSQRIQPPRATATVELLRGTLELNAFGFAPGNLSNPQVTATVGRAGVVARPGEPGVVTFDPAVRLEAGDTLEIVLGGGRVR